MWSGIRKFVIFGQFRQWSRKKTTKDGQNKENINDF